jgi:hypothetical protein
LEAFHTDLPSDFQLQIFKNAESEPKSPERRRKKLLQRGAEQFEENSDPEDELVDQLGPLDSDLSIEALRIKESFAERRSSGSQQSLLQFKHRQTISAIRRSSSKGGYNSSLSETHYHLRNSSVDYDQSN